MQKSITSFIDEEYKRYSLYTLYHRAIPSLVDGFKPSQRKAFYIIKNKQAFVKVQALSGQMISDANYNHGDVSASDTISKMVQDFTGANNIAPFIGDGTFGSKFIREYSAPRYVFAKPNPKYYQLFKDFEICESSNMEDPEPDFYLPIIPTVLLNGIEGIAVGFACKIQPYYIKDIITLVKEVIGGIDRNSLSTLTPYYHDYIGDYTYDQERNIVTQYGVYEEVNTTTIHISEVPVVYDREKYHKILNGLLEKKEISSFIDNSKEQWDITIRLPRKSKVWKDPIEYLKLSSNLNENITVIDQHGKLKIYDFVEDLLFDFVKFRLEMYQKRIDYMLNRIREDATLVKAKIKFILELQKFDYSKTKKKDLEAHFQKLDFQKDHLDKCFAMPMTNLNRDYLLKMKQLLDDLKTEFHYYKNSTSKDLYLEDIKELEKNL